MNTAKKTSPFGKESWVTYKRLLGYSSRYKGVALIAIIGMIIDPACLEIGRAHV